MYLCEVAVVSQLCISFPYVVHGLCEDYLTCDIAFNAVMPPSRASTRGRYSRIEGVTPDSVRGWQSTWFYCQDQSTPGQSTGLPPFSMSRVDKPASLKVLPEEKTQVKLLMERVVQLIRDGVTGMDLLEVFLRRRIQPLQY